MCGSVEHYKKDCPDLEKQQGMYSTTVYMYSAIIMLQWCDLDIPVAIHFNFNFNNQVLMNKISYLTNNYFSSPCL